MNLVQIRNILSSKGLKVTPQRVAVYEALIELDSHPTAEMIVNHLHKDHPNISRGTVYNILDTFVSNDIIRKVKTDLDVMRYDPKVEDHHHLYCKQCDRIEDYADPELDKMLKEYFDKNGIDGFKIEDIRLQIMGDFI